MPPVSLDRGWQSPELRCTITRTASLSDLQAAFVMDSARTKASCSGCVSLRRGWTTPEPGAAPLAHQQRGAGKRSDVVRPLALRRKRSFSRISTIDENAKPKNRTERVSEVETFLKIHRAPISSLDFVFVEPLNTLGKYAPSSFGKTFSAGDELVKSGSSSSKKQRREIIAKFYQQHHTWPAQKNSPTSVAAFPNKAVTTTDGPTPGASTREARRESYQKWLLSKRAPLSVPVGAQSEWT